MNDLWGPKYFKRHDHINVIHKQANMCTCVSSLYLKLSIQIYSKMVKSVKKVRSYRKDKEVKKKKKGPTH